MTLPDPYYSDDHVTLYLGDCLELLPLLPRCDLLATDPPYGEHTHANAKSNKGGGSGVKALDFAPIDFERLRSLVTLANPRRWAVMTVEFRHAAAFDTSPPDGFELLRVGAWVKANPMPQISADRPGNGWEAIAYLHNLDERKRWNGGGSHGNYVLNVDHSNAHPTSKPPAMAQSFIERFSDEGDLILDPFAGSGTTLRAAKDLGRTAIGIEIEERYCEIAARRLGQEVLDFGSVPA